MSSRCGAVEEVVGTGEADRDPECSERHRNGSPNAGTEPRVDDPSRNEDRGGEEPAREVISRGRPGTGLQEVRVDEVQSQHGERGARDADLGQSRWHCCAPRSLG